MSHPDRILGSLAWSCSDDRYATPEALSAAIRRYHLAVFESDERWQPDELVLASPRVSVIFECWEGDDQRERRLELSCDDPRGFTALALIYGIHEGIAEHLQTYEASLGDHCFFEGLVRSDAPGEFPTYWVRFGS